MEITWNDIEQHVAACTQCPLCQTRRRLVMGRGSHQADIMLVAEAPGGQEDQQGLPFVGRSFRGNIRRPPTGLRPAQRRYLYHQYHKMPSSWKP